MKDLLLRFSLRSIKFNWIVVAALVLIWLSVLASVVSSVLAQPFSRRQRIFWLTLVIAVPLFGVLAYLPFSFKKEDLPHIFLAKAKKSKKRRGSHSAGNATRNL